MDIKTLVLGPVGACCYVLSTQSGEGAVIDPGEYTYSLEQTIIGMGITELKYIMCTHGHFDHISGVAALKEKYPAAKVVVGKGDASALSSSLLSLADAFGLTLTPCCADITVSGGDELRFGDVKISVFEAPGHSLGGVLYYCENEGALFTGDTLFKCSVGRTDLYGGDYATLIKTLKRFSSFPIKTRVYPGHGERTSIEFEMKYNPYLK